MEVRMALATKSKHTLVLVQPGVQRRWEVLLEGYVKSPQFSDRCLALSYAKMWASVNRPSKIRVSNLAGNVEHEWEFR